MNLKKLKVAMLEKEITVESLCKTIGWNQDKYYRRIRGDTAFTQDDIKEIRDAIGLSNEDIIEIFFT